MKRPGPRRLRCLDDQQPQRLLEQARKAGDQAEAARQQILEHAQRRQDLVLQLYDGGVSVRDIAVHLNVSPTVVQSALVAARGRSRSDHFTYS